MNYLDEAIIHESASELVLACHGAAYKAGWWHDPKTGDPLVDNPMNFAKCLVLITSELAEAMEADRKNLMDDKLPHRHGREVEIADAIIRLFDLCGGYGMDIGGAIVEKLAYNATRADHRIENRIAEGGKAY